MLRVTHIKCSWYILRQSWQVESFPENTDIWKASKTRQSRTKENKQQQQNTAKRRTWSCRHPQECRSLGILRNLLKGLGLPLNYRVVVSAKSQDDSRNTGKVSQRRSGGLVLHWMFKMINIHFPKKSGRYGITTKLKQNYLWQNFSEGLIHKCMLWPIYKRAVFPILTFCDNKLNINTFWNLYFWEHQIGKHWPKG